MYQTILFDLDGTLTDPNQGILNSVIYSLEKMQKSIPTRETLLPFIGPPLLESYQNICGLSQEEANKAISLYREYFSVKGLFENHVYPDIEKLLASLQSDGKQLVIATSKPEVFAKQILAHFQLDNYFTLIAGASLDNSRLKKSDVIRYALAQLEHFHASSTIMVGDREHDIFGAKENGLDSIGVLYGFGSQEELKTAGASYLVENVLDIYKIVNNN